jgi:cytochrome c
MALATGSRVRAQMPTYRLGKTPTDADIRGQDITPGPSGKELPPGKGTAKEGAEIFAKKCAHCHGATGTEGQFPKLVGGNVAKFPFATTIWDFINTAMPRNVPDIGLRDGTLTPDEVYALTAFLLYRNNVLKENDVLDAKNLPKIRMPNRDTHLDRLAPRGE